MPFLPMTVRRGRYRFEVGKWYFLRLYVGRCLVLGCVGPPTRLNPRENAKHCRAISLNGPFRNFRNGDELSAQCKCVCNNQVWKFIANHDGDRERGGTEYRRFGC